MSSSANSSFQRADVRAVVWVEWCLAELEMSLAGGRTVSWWKETSAGASLSTVLRKGAEALTGMLVRVGCSGGGDAEKEWTMKRLDSGQH